MSAVTETTRFGFPAELWCHANRSLGGLVFLKDLGVVQDWITCSFSIFFGKGTSEHRLCRESRLLLTGFLHSHVSLADSLVVDKHCYIFWLQVWSRDSWLILGRKKKQSKDTGLEYKERCCDEHSVPGLSAFMSSFLSCIFPLFSVVNELCLFLGNKNVNSEALVNAHTLLIDTKQKCVQ